MNKTIGLQPNTIFLMDGLGALLSAALLYIVVIFFIDDFGMNASALRLLSGIALMMSCFSLSVYFFSKAHVIFFLRTIGAINLVYCFLTIGLIIFHFSELGVLALLYFFIEIFTIVFLTVLEFKTAAALKKIK